MQLRKILTLLLFASVVQAQPDPKELFPPPDKCTNCNELHALDYQRCVLDKGNACASVGDTGEKKDYHCCGVTTKHMQCLKCAEKSKEYNTNRNYYRERAVAAQKDQ